MLTHLVIFFGGVLTGGMIVFLAMRRRHLTITRELASSRRDASQRAAQISVVSHEMRTPLASVKAAAAVLAEERAGPITSDQARFLGIMVRQSDLAIDIAEDLLLQARLESGTARLYPSAVEVGRLVRQTVEAVRPMTDMRGQRLVCNLPRLDPIAWVDERLIGQALTNLLSNAVRHTSVQEQITVTLTGDDDTLVLSVTDGGAGMTPQERQQLFARFASGDGSWNRAEGSTDFLGASVGLGMVLTRQIAELHGGRLLVDTAQRRGTTVMMALPLRGAGDPTVRGRFWSHRRSRGPAR